MAKRKQIDWEAIERQYRLGQKSVRSLATEFGVSHTAIGKRVKKEGWVQDKTAEIRAKTKAGLVSCQNKVSKKVATPTKEDVDVAVQTNIKAIRNHIKIIDRTLNLVNKLLDKADETNVDLKSHGDLLRTIAQSIAKIFPLERQALNLDEEEASAVALKEILRNLSAETKQKLAGMVGDADSN